MLGLYIHVPWCRRRCIYCDFYFEVGKAKAGFADKILAEYHARKTEHEAIKAQSLYFGGGTPSTLSNEEISRLVDGLRGDLQEDAEISLELNPEDIWEGHLDARLLRKSGVNRISLGVQSFDDATLQWLSRKHNAAQAWSCIDTLHDAGFDNISVDFIVGVPGENLTQIQKAAFLCQQKGIKHLSLYLLTVEEKTPLATLIDKKRYEKPDDDEQADHYEAMQNYLPSIGYEQYEVSSYAQDGFESRHNRLYWSKGQYLGLGPGAHSMRLFDDGSVARRHNNGSLALWWKNPSNPPRDVELLCPTDAFEEAVAFGLRDMKAGVNLDVLQHRHHQKIQSSMCNALLAQIDKGFVLQKGEIFYLTPLGARFADAVAREIIG